MADENQTKFERTEDFNPIYANNVQFEASAWDLKLIFGQLDQSQHPLMVEQHTAITIPWAQAKIAAYFLIVNIIINQSQNGLINIPPAVIPGRPNPLEADLDEAGKRAIAYLAWVHDQFFSSSPYIPQGVDSAVGAVTIASTEAPADPSQPES